MDEAREYSQCATCAALIAAHDPARTLTNTEARGKAGCGHGRDRPGWTKRSTGHVSTLLSARSNRPARPCMKLKIRACARRRCNAIRQRRFALSVSAIERQTRIADAHARWRRAKDQGPPQGGGTESTPPRIAVKVLCASMPPASRVNRLVRHLAHRRHERLALHRRKRRPLRLRGDSGRRALNRPDAGPAGRLRGASDSGHAGKNERILQPGRTQIRQMR